MALPEANAWAAEPAPLGACPSRPAVADAVRALLLRSQVDLANVESEIGIVDAGARFTVSIRGRIREYADPARDCKERTRTAAVFVALTLAPPEIGAPTESAPTAADASQTPTPSSAGPPPEKQPEAKQAQPTSLPAPALDAKANPQAAQAPKVADPSAAPSASSGEPAPGGAQQKDVHRRTLAVELGVLGAFAPSSESAQWVSGAELRAALTFEGWGFSAGLSLPSPSTFEASGLRVKEERWSADGSLRFLFRGARIGGAFDLGLLTAVYQLKRDGAGSISGDRRLEFGLRAGASIELLPGAVTPFLRLFSEVVPVTREIAVEPRGVIGETPPLWLGATVGISGKFR